MTLRERIRAAKARAFQRYAEKYGELHHADPRVNTVIILNPEDADWTHDDFVAELLRRANNGEPYPMDDLTVRAYNPDGPYL